MITKTSQPNMNTLFLPVDGEDGLHGDVTIRTTTIDGVRYVSAVDVIKPMINPGGNPHDSWFRIIRSYPEIMEGVKMFKFQGAGQRDTPTLDVKRLVILLNVFPGHRAASFRMSSADIVVRYLGGDETLIAEIRVNTERQQNIPESDPMSMFNDEMKRKRAAFDLQEQEARIVRSRVETVVMVHTLLRDIHNDELDGPSKLLLRDAAQNSIASFGARMAVQDHIEADARGSGRRHLDPISDLFRSITGRPGNKSSWIKIGAAVVKEYRKRHDGQSPAKMERFIDGTTRMVNAYSTTEDPWLVDFIKANH